MGHGVVTIVSNGHTVTGTMKITEHDRCRLLLVSGDVVAMYDDAYSPLKSEVTITGSGLWNAPRTN